MLRRRREAKLAPMQWRVIRLGHTDSTSERAFAALASGEGRSGDVWVARSQEAGRGRLGRRWHSAPGEGLYLSALVVWEAQRVVPAPAWTLAGGLAVWALARRLGLADARLRWPNDLTVRGAKLAGVLAEARPAGNRPPHGVLGIGLNVRQTGFPAELLAERPVTSLALEGVDTGPEDLVEPLLAELGPRVEAALAGGAGLAEEFLGALGLAGEPVTVTTSAGERSGRLLELTLARPGDPGGVLLEESAGRVRLALEHVLHLAASPAGEAP